MKSRKAFIAWIVLASSLLCSAPAQAVLTITYTSLADFLAASKDLTTIDFEGLAPPGTPFGYSVGASGPLDTSNSGVTFSMTDPPGNWGPSSFAVTPYPTKTVCSIIRGDNPLQTLSITFPGAGVTAIALNYGALGGGGKIFTFTLSNGFTFRPGAVAFDPSLPNYGFIGFTSDTPFTSITLSDGGSLISPSINMDLDNVRFGSTACVPEPGLLTLLGLGVLPLGLMRSRRT